MPFHIGSGCLPATISNRRIYRIAWSDTPPEMSVTGSFKPSGLFPPALQK